MKRAFSLILICCIGFTIAGYYPVFKMLQYHVRQEIKHRIKAGLNESELQIITFKKQDHIDWVRPGKEFRLNENFYDVVRKEVNRDKIIFYCINDQQEKALFATLDHMVKNNLNDGQTEEGQTVQLLCKIFTEEYFIQETTIYFYTSGVELCYPFHDYTEMPGFYTTEFPPPDLI